MIHVKRVNKLERVKTWMVPGDGRGKRKAGGHPGINMVLYPMSLKSIF
jgi:hypothetical protein